MTEIIKKQIQDDYKEVLSTDAGRRVLGGIFFNGGLNQTVKRTDYQQGIFVMALMVANTVREVDPLGVGLCEKEYQDMIRGLNDDNGGRYYSNDTAEYGNAELTDTD